LAGYGPSRHGDRGYSDPGDGAAARAGDAIEHRESLHARAGGTRGHRDRVAMNEFAEPARCNNPVGGGESKGCSAGDRSAPLGRAAHPKGRATLPGERKGLHGSWPEGQADVGAEPRPIAFYPELLCFRPRRPKMPTFQNPAVSDAIVALKNEQRPLTALRRGRFRGNTEACSRVYARSRASKTGDELIARFSCGVQVAASVYPVPQR
jgi:hypothetical protein